MSKPTIVGKLANAVKRAFGKADQPEATDGTEETVSAASEPTETVSATPRAASDDAPTVERAAPSPAGDTEPAPTPSTGEEEAPTTGASDGTGDAEPLTDSEKSEIAEDIQHGTEPTVSADTTAFEAAKAALTTPSSDELPVPNYDTLTLPSIRGRLRKLTVEDVRRLRAYEVANANRPEFIKMYDNRIAKLEAESGQ